LFNFAARRSLQGLLLGSLDGRSWPFKAGPLWLALNASNERKASKRERVWRKIAATLGQNEGRSWMWIGNWRIKHQEDELEAAHCSLLIAHSRGNELRNQIRRQPLGCMSLHQLAKFVAQIPGQQMSSSRVARSAVAKWNRLAALLHFGLRQT